MAENRTPAPGSEDGPEPDAFARSLDMDAATYRELQDAFKAVDEGRHRQDTVPVVPFPAKPRSLWGQFVDGWRQGKASREGTRPPAGHTEKRPVLIAQTDATSVFGHTLSLQVVDLVCVCEKSCPKLRVLVVDQGPGARFVTPLASGGSLAQQVARMVLAYVDEGPEDENLVTP